MKFNELKTGDPFISLEEFIQLPDSTFSLFPWAACFCGAEWMFRYQLAKESWEKYGTTPPDGATVSVLVNGHGTYMPSLITPRDLKGLPVRTLMVDYSEKYFYLIREGDYRSLVDKALWWRSFVVKTHPYS